MTSSSRTEFLESSTPYPDILKLDGEHHSITDDVKYKVLTLKWENVHLFNFPIYLPYFVEPKVDLVFRHVIIIFEAQLRSLKKWFKTVQNR